MDKNSIQWEEYYNNISGRQPRQLLVDALKYFPDNYAGKAIDVGCGDGTETALLLANGWHVVAIDSEAKAFKYLTEKIPADAQNRLETQVSTFEDFELSPSDLIHASYSLPYCHPDHFDALWHDIVTNINSGGRFVGQLFGVNDTWATSKDMTFFTAQQVKALCAEFEVEYLREEDEDGASTLEPKHWHVFHLIIRKK